MNEIVEQFFRFQKFPQIFATFIFHSSLFNLCYNLNFYLKTMNKTTIKIKWKKKKKRKYLCNLYRINYL